MAPFLSVKEAASRTGKSPSSIRRILYPIIHDDHHPDRHHIEPDVETAKALRLKGENFAWKLSEELIDRERSTPAAKQKDSAPVGDAAAAIVDILRKQLEIKDEQIAAQNEVIKGLSERMHEGNVLMGSLQQKLAAPDRSKTDIVDAERAAGTPEEGSDRSTQSKKTHWLFKKLF